MGVSLTEVNKTLNRILDQLRSEAEIGILPTVMAAHSSRNIDLSALISKIEETIVLLTSLDGKDFATQTTLATIATETTVGAILTVLQSIDAILVFIENDTDLNSSINQHLGDIDNQTIHGGKGDAEWLSDIKDELSGDILTELESIDDNWNIASVNNVALLASTVFLESIDDDTTEIVGNTEAIESNTGSTSSRMLTLLGKQDEIIALLTLAHWRSYAFLAEYDVTAIPGTSLIIKIIVPAAQKLKLRGYRIRYVGLGTNNASLFVYDTSSNLSIGPALEENTAVTGSTTGLNVLFSEWINVKGGNELRLTMTGVAIGDILHFSILGDVRTETLPTIDDSTSTATATETIRENNID